MTEIERRTIAIKELRVAQKDDAPVIEGYAAVFNQLSEDLGGFREQIKPGAFADTIAADDIRALWNHDSNYVLGRNVAGTLELEEDSHGLKIRVTPPDTQWARDLVVSIKRGDVDQMSFGFRTVSDSWHKQDDYMVRDLEKVKLYDVSPVTYPAYPQTVVSARDILQAHTDASQAAVADESDAEARAQARLDVMRKKIDLIERGES